MTTSASSKRVTSLSALVARIGALPRPLLLAFDVDGTLAPIVDDPTRARVPTETRRALHRLAVQRSVHVALLTGRDAASLRALAPIAGVYRALEHGRVIVAPNERVRQPRMSRQERERLQAFERWANGQAVAAGAKLEHKPRSRALHVRVLAKRDAETADQLLRQAARTARALGLHVRPGRAVVEAELEPGDKGVALRALMRRVRARGVVYFGDDLTDLPAIRAAMDHGGLGLFVRSSERRPPRARSALLDGPQEVGALVAALAEPGALTGTRRRSHGRH